MGKLVTEVDGILRYTTACDVKSLVLGRNQGDMVVDDGVVKFTTVRVLAYLWLFNGTVNFKSMLPAEIVLVRM